MSKGPEEDPIFGILLLRQQSYNESSGTGFPKEFTNFFTFPEFSQNKIGIAFEKHKAGASYKDVLLELGFDYKFSVKFLTYLQNIEPKSTQEQTKIAKCILFSYISFFTMTDRSDYEIMLELLYLAFSSTLGKYALNAVKDFFISSIETNSPNYQDLLPMVFSLFNDYSPFASQIQDVLLPFLRMLCPPAQKDSVITPLAIRFMDFIAGYAQNHPGFFTVDLAGSFLYAVASYLVLLNPYVLSFFCNLAPSIDDAAALSLIMLLPMPIRDLIENQEPFLVAKDNNGNIVDWKKFIEQNKVVELNEYNETLKGNYSHPKRETFKNGVDVKRNFVLSEKLSCASLVREDLYKMLEKIGGASRVHKSACNSLLTWMSQCVKEAASSSDHFFDFVAVFICLFNIINDSSFVPLFWDTIYQTQLFDTRINLFDHDCEVSLFDQLRTFVFSDIAVDGFSFLPRLLRSFLQKPSLCAELLRRVLEEFYLIDTSVLSSSSFISSFCAILVYFQSLNIECDEEQIPLIETTRCISLIFLSQILQDQKLAAAWFQSRLFLTTYLAFVFEPNLRIYVLGTIKNYLASRADIPKGPLVNEIMDITKLVLLSFPDERDVVLATDLLEVMSEVMLHCPSEVSKFIDLTDSICPALNNLEASKANDLCLIQSLHFFSVVSAKLKLKSSYLQAITNAIQTIEPNGVSQAVLTNLKQMSAGTQTSSASPFFIIKQPKALKALLTVSTEDSIFKQVVQFLYSLVQFTYQNSIIMSQSGIDMLLLELLDKKKGTDIGQETLDAVFTIITQISLVSSSTLFVHRFLSLMFPMEGKILSQYQQLFIKKLIEITNLCNMAPRVYIPIHSQANIKVHHANSSLFSDSFTMFFWVFIDRAVSQAHAKIIEIFDKKLRGFNLFVSSGSLLFTCFTKTLESTARFDLTLPKGQWFQIAVEVFKTKNDKTGVYTYINDETSRRIEFNWEGFKPGPLDFTIGDRVEILDSFSHSQSSVVKSHSTGSLSSSMSGSLSGNSSGYDFNIDTQPETKTPPVLLANINIVNDIEEDMIKSLIDSQSNTTDFSQVDLVLSLQLLNHEGFVKPSIKSVDKNISCDLLSDYPLPCTSTFIDVLISLCKVNAIVPLFSLFDMKTKSGQMFPDLPDLVFEFFTSTIQMSVDIQKSFFESKVMKIIAHLIYESKTFPRTYNMYIRFYTMMCAIEYQPLQQSVCETLLCDFNLLSKYDLLTQLRIVKHWRRVILPAYSQILTNTIPIHTIVSAIHTQYEKQMSYPSSGQSARSGAPTSATTTSSIRKELWNLVIDISSYSINEDDILILVSQAISTNNLAKIKESLWVLNEIFSTTGDEEQKSPIYQLKFHIAQIVLLNGVIANGDDETLIYLVNIIASVHRLGLLPSIPSQLHYELVMQNIQPMCCTRNAAMELAQLTNRGIFELLPLTLYVTMNVNDDALYDVFESLTPHKLSLHSKMWVIAAIDKSPSDIRHMGLKYLIACETDWMDTYNTMISICSSQKSDPYSMINEMLIIIGNSILEPKLEDVDEQKLDSYFSLCNNSIFYHTFRKSSTMSKEFQNSPYYLLRRNIPIAPTKKGKLGFSSDSENKRNSLSYDYDDDDSDSYNNMERDECSFSKIRARSMMSRSFIFVSGEHLNMPSDDQINDEDLANDQISRSFSENTVSKDLPKINIKKRRSSTDTDSSKISATSSDTVLPPLEPINSPIISTPTKTAFLYKPPPTDDSVLKFSMNDLYANIEQFSKHKKDFIFTIRRDKNGRWLDIDLALLCLKVYAKHQLPLHFNFIILLSSVLLHYQPLQVEKYMRLMDPSSSVVKNSNLMLTKFVTEAQKLGLNIRQVPFLNQIQPNPLKSYMAIDSVSTNQSTEIEFQKLYSSADSIVKDNIKMLSMQDFFISLENAENIGFAMKEHSRFVFQQQKHQRENQRLWVRLWNRMTMQLAIWESAAPKKTGFIFTRDMTLGSSYAPIKQKCRRILLTNQSVVFSNQQNYNAVNDPNRCVAPCLQVKQTGDKKCFIEVTKEKIILTHLDSSITKVILPENIEFIIQITRYGERKSIELSRAGRKIYLFEFNDSETCEKIMQFCRTNYTQIPFISKPESTPTDFLEAFNASERWVTGELSNFQYLILVNFAAGRTFCDPSIYPIFPWIITDYTSESIDLSKPDIYRDLRKLIGVTSDERLSELSKAHNGYYFDKSLLPGDFVLDLLQNSKINDLSNHKIDSPQQLLEYCETNNFEIIPEFYCYPELFFKKETVSQSKKENENNFYIKPPKWSSESAQIFVYKNRCALESFFVSATLHFWIDNVFGIKTQNSFYNPIIINPTYDFTKEQFLKYGTLPRNVFLSTHKGRSIEVKESLVERDCLIPTGSRGIASVSVVKLHTGLFKHVLEFSIVLRSGIIRRILVDLKTRTTIQPSSSATSTYGNMNDITFDKSFLANSPSQQTIQPLQFNGLNSGFVMTNTTSPNALVILPSQNKSETINLPFGLVWNIFTTLDSPFVSTVCSDMTTRVWDLSKSYEQPIVTISSYRDETICSALCSSYGIIVTGTRDGSLQVCNFEGSVQRVITMKDRKPLRLMVTAGLGLIIVYSEKMDDIQRGKELIVYTINGLLLARSSAVDSSSHVFESLDITCWTFWTDSKGLDYAAIGSEKGKIHILELGNLSLVESDDFSGVIKVNSKPISLEYVNEARVLSIATENGDIHLYPINQ